MTTAERLADIFKVLANPIRLKILALCLHKERSSRELREILGISKPLLINHIRKLVKVGLLRVRVEIDEERSIVRKFYRTSNFEIALNVDTLAKIYDEEFGANSLKRS